MITHPLAKSNLKYACKILGTASKGEKLKIKKHKQKPDDIGATFIPYLVDSFGGVGKEARVLNKIISNYAEKNFSTLAMTC